MATTYIANNGFDNKIIWYVIPGIILMKNDKRIMSKLISAFGASLKLKLEMTREYPPECSEKVKHYNITLFAKLLHYINKNQHS